MSDEKKKQSGVRNLLQNELSGLQNLDNILNPHANKQQEEKKIIPEIQEYNVETNENQTVEEEQQEEQKHLVPTKKIKREITKIKVDLATINPNTTLEELMDLVFKKREEKSKGYSLSGYILPHLYKKLSILSEIRDVSTKESLNNLLELFFKAHAVEIEKEIRDYLNKSLNI